MSELRTRLERLGNRIQPAPDAFDRLERTRRRRQRSRRIAAGLVAFLVAAAGSLTAFTAFRDGEPTAGGAVEAGFFALWPEKTYKEALVEQLTIDQGALSRRAWRLDPLATAEEFARSALGWGWDSPGEVEIHAEVASGGDVAGPGPITVDVSLLRHGPGATALFASVTEARLVRPDGIWSVVEVGGDAFDLRVTPGEQVEVGGFVVVPTTLEGGTEVAAGIAGTGACSGFHEQTAEVVDGHIVVPVQGIGENCSGYLYVLTPPTPTGQVELGRIMFLWNEAKPALGYTIESIAAVPVRFVAHDPDVVPPSEAPSTEDALRVTCDPTTIEVATQATAGPAGIRVLVENTSDDPIFFQFAAADGPWGGTEVPAGFTELALQAPPGGMTVRCWADGEAAEEVSVEVLDPQGLFVPFDVACPGEPALVGGIPVGGWLGSTSTPEPIEFVRTHIEGLLPSDVLERAGYPKALDPVVRLVRDGAVVGSFGIHREFGQWALDGTWCSGIGISVPPGPDPYPRGWFEWCPEGPFPEPGRDWSDRASEVAVRFAQAYVDGDEATLAQVLDASVPAGAEFTAVLAEGVEPIVGGTDAHGGQIVNYSCGNDVDAYTVAVTIDDGTDSASADFTVFLVLRDDGWKVWGVY